MESTTNNTLRTNSEKTRYWHNRDLLIIAILSGLGGVMSTYVGYLGNLLNRMLGVPFGAGQFVAGLHVFWIVLAAGLVRKPGAATMAGLLKGVIELLTGSTHGVVIVMISLVQGLLVEVVLLLWRRHSLPAYMLAGGLAAASNVVMFQLLYFSGAPITYLLFISMLAFFSGALLGGSFAMSVMEMVFQARPIRMSAAASNGFQAVHNRQRWKGRHWITLGLTLALSAGAFYYFAFVFELPGRGPELRVEGAVENPVTLNLSQLSDATTTITAELIGEITHVPPQEYTGIPMWVILERVEPLPEAATLEVIASDGYTVTFHLQDVMDDHEMVLIEESDTLRLIAGAYPGGHWVKMVNRLVVR